jgi:competence protein ComEC
MGALVADGAASWVQRALLWPLQWLMAARGHLFVWIPVFMGAGVGTWFALPYEPGAMHYALCAALIFGAGLGIWRGPDLARPVFIALMCAASGFGAASLRGALVAAPMLDFHYYGPVQGRVTHVDRSAADALRITLDTVVLGDVAPAKTPHFVRISLQEAPFAPAIGATVLLTAHLSAPEGPTEPNAFDYRRMAYFQRLGAVGYTRAPVVLWEHPQIGGQWFEGQAIDRLREKISGAMIAAMPSQAGAFATGAMTGDRSAITQDTVQDLRDSNLSHLLAISGMNLAFLAGFVFLLLRYGIALVPPLALRVDAKKIAAVVAFGVALFYWLLSGANISTTRAMLMISVMLGAVLLDRQALSMRAVAISAIILLLVQPESLLDAGFQLSFAATIALIGGYGALSRAILAGRAPRWLMPLYALVLTSVVAGLATAPYAAAHFNRFTDYGLLANLLTAWAMSVLMAAGVIAALLAPLGAEAPAMWVMEWASQWILTVAAWVADLDGAVTAIPVPSATVLPLITLGGLWFLVWQGARRLIGLPVLALALALWAVSDRPDVLISSDGRVAGVMQTEGRALSHPRGAGFAVTRWLENDGDLVSQEIAAARAGFDGPKDARAFAIGPYAGVMLAGKAVAARFQDACARHDLVVLPAAFDPAELGNIDALPCRTLDRRILDNSGAFAGVVEEGKLILTPTRAAQRQWSSPRPIVPPIILAQPKNGSAGYAKSTGAGGSGASDVLAHAPQP